MPAGRIRRLYDQADPCRCFGRSLTAAQTNSYPNDLLNVAASPVTVLEDQTHIALTHHCDFDLRGGAFVADADGVHGFVHDRLRDILNRTRVVREVAADADLAVVVAFHERKHARHLGAGS